MKKLILPLLLMLLGFTGFASSASAQRYEERTDERTVETRYDGPRITISRDRDGDRGGRGAYELERLNREVRQVRDEMRQSAGGGRHVRARFYRVMRATDRLNYQFRRGARSWEIRRGADAIRDELQQLRRELHFRGPRRGDWR